MFDSSYSFSAYTFSPSLALLRRARKRPHLTLRHRTSPQPHPSHHVSLSTNTLLFLRFDLCSRLYLCKAFDCAVSRPLRWPLPRFPSPSQIAACEPSEQSVLTASPPTAPSLTSRNCRNSNSSQTLASSRPNNYPPSSHNYLRKRRHELLYTPLSTSPPQARPSNKYQICR